MDHGRRRPREEAGTSSEHAAAGRPRRRMKPISFELQEGGGVGEPSLVSAAGGAGAAGTPSAPSDPTRDSAGGARPATPEDDDDLDPADIPDDVISALSLLCAQFPRPPPPPRAGCRAPPLAGPSAATRPFALKSQLYSVVRDRTAVDRALQRLSRTGDLLCFKVVAHPHMPSISLNC